MDLRRALEPLLRPHPSITAPHERRLARLAPALLLALLVVVLAAFLFPDSGEGGLTGHRLTLFSFVGMLVGYGLVRSGRLALGVLAFLATVETGLSLSVLSSEDHETGLLLLAFFCVPIAVAGILLRVPAAIAVALATIAVGVVLESRIEGHRLGLLDEHGWTLVLLLGAVSVVSVLASWMAQRQSRLLHENAELLRQVTETLPEVFFLVSADGKHMRYTNRAYETVTGRRIEQALADPQDWLKAVHPDDLPAVQRELAAGRPELEYRVLHPSGAVRHLRARTFPVLGPQGKVENLVGLAEDVTAVKLAQEQLREAQRKRIHLLQQLAHDLAAPLSPVRIQLHLLRQRAPPEFANSVAILERNVSHAQRLVEDIKDVARLEGGDLKLVRRPTDLAGLVRNAVEAQAAPARERGVALAADAAAPVPVEADDARLTQVLYNLIGNALKFTPEGGRIDVLLAREGAQARVDVRDSGAGMAPEQLARLFQPFSQVHAPGSIKRPEDKGSGLGLYISKGIVEAHGGTIGVASDGPGQGSTFTFRLPLEKAGDGPR